MDCERLITALPNYLKENEYFKFLLEELTIPIKKISGTKVAETYHFYVPIKEKEFFPFTLSIDKDGKVSLANSWIDIKQIEDGENIFVKRFSSVTAEKLENKDFIISNRDISVEQMQIDRMKRNPNSKDSIEIISEVKEVKFQTLEVRKFDSNGSLKSIHIKRYTPYFVTDKNDKIWEEVSSVQETSQRYFLSPSESILSIINHDNQDEQYYYVEETNTDEETRTKINKEQYLEYLNQNKKTNLGPKKVLIPQKK